LFCFVNKGCFFIGLFVVADVALHFVKDPQVRFNLALQCGELEVALAAARQLEDVSCWSALATAALAVGDFATAELGLARAGDTAGLATLALCAGRRPQLARLAATTSASGDVMSTFHSNVLRGDVGAMAQQLEKAGLSQLAFICCATHGLSEEAGKLAAVLQEKNIPLPSRPVPPEMAFAPHLAPVLVEAEPGFVWPKLASGPRSALDAALASQKSATLLAVAESATGGSEDMGDWGGDDLVLPGSENNAQQGNLLDEPNKAEEEGGGWGDLDLDSVLVAAPEEKGAGGKGASASAASKDFFVAPPPGESKPASWVRLSRLPCDAAAAGDWLALRDQLLSQVGVTNLAPLKPYALAVYRGARLAVDGLSSVPGLTPPLQTYLLRGTDGKLPLICITLASLVPQLQVWCCFQLLHICCVSNSRSFLFVGGVWSNERWQVQHGSAGFSGSFACAVVYCY
jgi:coatomer protein complex subunit alpha (xenin)